LEQAESHVISAEDWQRLDATLSVPVPVHKMIYDAMIPLERRVRETFPIQKKSPRMKTKGNMNIE
jgi:hypothetical protein